MKNLKYWFVVYEARNHYYRRGDTKKEITDWIKYEITMTEHPVLWMLECRLEYKEAENRWLTDKFEGDTLNWSEYKLCLYKEIPRDIWATVKEHFK